MADNYGMTKEQMLAIIERGKIEHNQNFNSAKYKHTETKQPLYKVLKNEIELVDKYTIGNLYLNSIDGEEIKREFNITTASMCE